MQAGMTIAVIKMQQAKCKHRSARKQPVKPSADAGCSESPLSPLNNRGLIEAKDLATCSELLQFPFPAVQAGHH